MPIPIIPRVCAALLALALCACASARPAPPPAPGTAAAPPDAEVQQVRAAAIPITGAETDYDALVRMVGDARFVFLGEATHGTHEFYRERARITERLIRDLGFSAIAVEGDWPDGRRVDRFIHGEGPDAPERALAGFAEGFPQWMWANTDIRDLIVRLRAMNRGRPPGEGVSFYGLDVYSLFESADSVLAYLRIADPTAAAEAERGYGCFRRHRPDPQRYGLAAASGAGSCQAQAEQVAARMAARHAARAPGMDREASFAALQHARVVQNAEEYFRLLYQGGESTWNRRDQHMAETLDAILAHLAEQGRTPRVVVWAHNTHSGDARHSDMGERGELSVGQVMRERHDGHTVLIGFTTYGGTVMAAEEWDAPGRVRRLNPGWPESYAGLFHQTGIPAFFLPFRGNAELSAALAGPRLERAVGVVYAPATELQSHYFPARLPQRFDAVIHIDSTTAVTPVRP
ncbi:MAG TPA: erythromycin esterase family protein [Longimicrobium sp.]|jgi:erythromycin esterase-like protein|uniref:erythromycin esterase family protein n=1 Tax=Longimicrobium sp. TaxID=2029185 RepID=UPI002ED9EAB8